MFEVIQLQTSGWNLQFTANMASFCFSVFPGLRIASPLGLGHIPHPTPFIVSIGTRVTSPLLGHFQTPRFRVTSKHHSRVTSTRTFRVLGAGTRELGV